MPTDQVSDAHEQVSKSLIQLRTEITQAEEALNKVSRSRTLALALGIPLFVITLALLAASAEKIFQFAPKLNAILGFAGCILVLWLLAALIVVPFYYFLLHRNYVYARDMLIKLEDTEIARRLSTVEGRKQYFREQLFSLSRKAARVFFGDERRFDEASGWIKKAVNILDEAESAADLSIVQSYVNSLNELVTREEREQKDERYWQFAAVGTMLLYVVLLIVAALSTIRNQQVLGMPIFGVPLAVILWGAAGSLAAILYRFYTEQGRIRFAAEFRWLIARPVIGIIMGAVVYLALFSGLVLLVSKGGFSTGTGANVAESAGQSEVVWIIAFLAGFSDKVYLGVIDLLVARTVRTEEVNSNTVITEKERIPDLSSSREEPKGVEKGNTTE